MTVRLSTRVERRHPELRGRLSEVVGACRVIDGDLRTRDLLVEARCHPFALLYRGWAYPDVVSRSRGHTRLHRNGRILLSIGDQVEFEEVARVFAHELRHIAQFHRGFKRLGYLTANHMTLEDSEADAYGFEDRVLGRMGLAA